jgi:hypothetical protein
MELIPYGNADDGARDAQDYDTDDDPRSAEPDREATR